MMPEMIIRQVRIQNLMGESIVIDNSGAPEEGWNFDDAESKSGDNKSFDVWED